MTRNDPLADLGIVIPPTTRLYRRRRPAGWSGAIAFLAGLTMSLLQALAAAILAGSLLIVAMVILGPGQALFLVALGLVIMLAIRAGRAA